MSALLAFLVVALAWVLVSGRASRWSITGPIVLTVGGFLAATGPLDVVIDLESETIRELIEITLAVVLFSDASSIGVRWFRTEWQFPARLLGIGLPLTVVLGTIAAWWFFPGTEIWVLAVVAATLAPTDAALGAAIIEDERIPLRFRQVINVESGLNDGLATPVVSFCLAIAAATVDGGGDRPVVGAIADLALGVVLGFVIGAVGGRLVTSAGARGWSSARLRHIAPVLLAVGSYLGVVALGGNGFVAAFVCGVAFGGAARHEPHEELFRFTEQVGLLLGLGVWFVFGAGVLGELVGLVSWQMVAYALLSLTVLRMGPVAIAAVGLRLPWDTVALAGWLGPRGLASIVFAILAFDTLGGADGQFVLATVAVAVAMSVLAHGLSAGPLAGWYSRRHPVDSPAPGA